MKGAARELVERALPAIAAGPGETLALTLAIELKSVEVSRFGSVRPAGEGHAMTVAASASSPDALLLTMDPLGRGRLVSALFGGDPDMRCSVERDLSPTETEVASRSSRRSPRR